MDEALTSLPGLEAASYRRVLADRSFLLLWLSHAISQTAHSAILFTLLVLVAKAGTSLHSSLLVLAYVAPSLVLGLGAGTAVDRWPKATVLTVANGLRGLAALGFLLWADDLQALYGITLLFAIASQLFYQPVVPDQAQLGPHHPFRAVPHGLAMFDQAPGLVVIHYYYNGERMFYSSMELHKAKSHRAISGNQNDLLFRRFQLGRQGKGDACSQGAQGAGVQKLAWPLGPLSHPHPYRRVAPIGYYRGLFGEKGIYQKTKAKGMDSAPVPSFFGKKMGKFHFSRLLKLLKPKGRSSSHRSFNL